LATTLEALPDGMAKTLDRSTGVMAEQASFILASHMPRADAQALVKEAAGSGRPLAEALAELSDIDVDWSLRLQPSSAIQSSKAIAQAIFIARGDRD
ncbi:MAG: 3-carboxy-cis,cis-muconate cycloisomerase, partial [Pseudomonadota bacterium]